MMTCADAVVALALLGPISFAAGLLLGLRDHPLGRITNVRR